MTQESPLSHGTDNFNLALANIRASGFGDLTFRQQLVLDQMIHDFPWAPTIPERLKDQRLTTILSYFGKWYPGLKPVLDGYEWRELPREEECSNGIFDDEHDIWILFATEDGFYFYFELTDEMYPAGRDLEQWMEFLYYQKHYRMGLDGIGPNLPGSKEGTFGNDEDGLHELNVDI